VGSRQGLSDDKLNALPDYATSPLFDERERVALEYADAMSRIPMDVSDALFSRLRQHFSDDALVELTTVVAWENASSRFNRAMRIPAQGLWACSPEG
jgi:alkylhydroperoxidase family enzyme